MNPVYDLNVFLKSSTLFVYRNSVLCRMIATGGARVCMVVLELVVCLVFAVAACSPPFFARHLQGLPASLVCRVSPSSVFGRPFGLLLFLLVCRPGGV